MIRMPPGAFDELRVALESVDFNCLFAKSVVAGLVDGQVWCDKAQGPTFAHIIHPYGMTLLLALSADPDFTALNEHINWCRRFVGTLWMQVFPQSLASKIDSMLNVDRSPIVATPNGVQVQRFARSNFVFIGRQYEASHRLTPLEDYKVQRMTSEEFALPGISVSPQHFWRNADEFMSHGGGWVVVKNREVVSLAFTSFRLGSQLEIGVETYPEHRGRGLAGLAAAALIDQCIESGSKPVWSCRKQNLPSYRLAQTLGFSPTVECPYYHLPRILSPS
jgi:RimJ/RimL family protein N-acetyltransferase